MMGAASLAAGVAHPADPARSEPAVAGYEVVPRGPAADGDVTSEGNVAPGGIPERVETQIGTAPGANGATPTTTSVSRPVNTPPVTIEPVASGLVNADWPAFDNALLRPLGAANSAVAVAVRKNGVLVHEGARGMANRMFGVVATPDSKFRIASNSKTISAIVALQLVAEGKVGLDEPLIADLAKAYGVSLGDKAMDRVTLRHLLGHRSGFADFNAEFFRNASVGCEDAAMRAMRGRLSSTPGGRLNYSNMNFCLVSLLIEQIGGDGYDALVEEKLLQPLGITGARLAGNNEMRVGEVVHNEGSGRNFMEVLEGAGSWVASPKDMTKILDSLDPDRPGFHPLPADLARQMYAPNGTGLGLGTRLWGSTWGHTGTIQGAHSIMVHRPDGYTIAVTVAGETPSETDDLLGYIRRAMSAAGLA